MMVLEDWLPVGITETFNQQEGMNKETAAAAYCTREGMTICTRDPCEGSRDTLWEKWLHLQQDYPY